MLYYVVCHYMHMQKFVVGKILFICIYLYLFYLCSQREQHYLVKNTVKLYYCEILLK